MRSIATPIHHDDQKWSEKRKRLRSRRHIEPARLRFVGLVTMLALAVATLGASLVHEVQSPPTSWVPVAKIAIPAGAALLPQDLELRKTVLPSWLASSVTSNPTSLIGQIATSSIAPDEIIEGSMVSHVAPAAHLPLVTLTLSTSTVAAGLVQPGDRIDVIATYTAASGVASSEVLATDLRVTALSSSNGTYLITVGVDHVETALALYQAEQIGKIALIGATGVTGHTALRVYPPIGAPHVP
ncbi:SAF domain-containing protein [Ferrimicrobium acidiphilum]|uniref:SAF domain protein n=1 Tax=Ferrimicrobium acidiphilum DSM 19497 TaxID=1121877 RepID=A0A0D8FS70_9ACTN|nr:SAF domain-containing protein [Ferrimicrobium acidiphilum]KJE75976.1 SAF domain protein [Ferrimicrobium acidiphilum DSM 19497]MCL5052877.1 SAF domain-containing protein [Gammaproteobacteria bacterium]